MELPFYCNGESRQDYSLKRLCPRCESHHLPIGYPGALSHWDNETEICSDCGKDESHEGVTRKT